jgi:hypothetical protein
MQWIGGLFVNGAPLNETKALRRNSPGETARKIELYSSAYKLARGQIPPLRIRPYMFLHIHASIRRQIRAGETDARVIASGAVKDALAG